MLHSKKSEVQYCILIYSKSWRHLGMRILKTHFFSFGWIQLPLWPVPKSTIISMWPKYYIISWSTQNELITIENKGGLDCLIPFDLDFFRTYVFKFRHQLWMGQTWRRPYPKSPFYLCLSDSTVKRREKEIYLFSASTIYKLTYAEAKPILTNKQNEKLKRKKN